MATATKIQLVEFNKDEALNGASLHSLLMDK